MKRTNVFLEDRQISRINKLAERENVPAAEITRRALDFGLLMLDVEGPLADIDYVRKEMEAKDGMTVHYQQVFQRLAQEKAAEYRDKQNNRARITTLAESQAEVKQGMIELRLQVAQLTSAVLAMTQAMNRMEGDGK